MVAYDDIGGKVDPCTIFVKECAAEKRAKGETEQKERKEEKGKKKDGKSKTDKAFGGTLIALGSFSVGWGLVDLLTKCVAEDGIALPDGIFIPAIECSHALLRISLGGGLGGLGVVKFLPPKNNKNNCKPNEKSDKKKKQGSSEQKKCNRLIA